MNVYYDIKANIPRIIEFVEKRVGSFLNDRSARTTGAVDDRFWGCGGEDGEGGCKAKNEVSRILGSRGNCISRPETVK